MAMLGVPFLLLLAGISLAALVEPSLEAGVDYSPYPNDNNPANFGAPPRRDDVGRDGDFPHDHHHHHHHTYNPFHHHHHHSDNDERYHLLNTRDAVLLADNSGADDTIDAGDNIGGATSANTPEPMAPERPPLPPRLMPPLPILGGDENETSIGPSPRQPPPLSLAPNNTERSTGGDANPIGALDGRTMGGYGTSGYGGIPLVG